VSRARATKDRVPLDAYSTPDELALAICAALHRRGVEPEEIIEPSAGDGSFIRAALATWPNAHVTAIDIDVTKREPLGSAGAHLVIVGDWKFWATRIANQQGANGKSRLVVGNPPFRQAQEHIEAALDLLHNGDRLAFLLRLNFLGSRGRVDFWRRLGLETVQVIAPRPSFTGGGTDGTEYAVFVWRKGYRGAPRILTPLVWAPERARRLPRCP